MSRAKTREERLNMVSRHNLDGLAAELAGIRGTVEILSYMVQPKDTSAIDIPSQATLEDAFYHVMSALERIADDLSALEFEKGRASK